MRSLSSPSGGVESPRRADEITAGETPPTAPATSFTAFFASAMKELSVVAKEPRFHTTNQQHSKTNAIDKLGHLVHTPKGGRVGSDAGNNSTAFDVASLVLYGTHAIPIRLKILLDRLLSALPHDEVLHVLHGFGWTYEDYVRGYIIQDHRGCVLDKWTLVGRHEEPLIIQQFQRFPETRGIAAHFILSDIETTQQPEADLKQLIEKSAKAVSLFTEKHLEEASRNLAVSLMNNVIPPSKLSPPLNKTPSQTSATVTSTRSVSPPGETSSSPLTSPSMITSAGTVASPLNQLKNMQPRDFRNETNILHHERLADTPKHHRQPSDNLTMPPQSNSRMSGCTSPEPSQKGQPTFGSDRSLTDNFSDDESSNGAINLSAGAMFSSDKTNKHLRKSSNPMKRRWNPMVLSTLTTNPSTGKRRVQCHVCLKTFCDKGALKIHFSAVHLREMHKCTVEGCNMMFSSRRSRNRHSANPNPKLHTPNLRRKISPHDGRTANPFPVLPPTSLLALNAGITSPSDINSVLQDGLSKLPLSFPNYPSSSPDPTLFQNTNSEDGNPISLMKKPRLSESSERAELKKSNDHVEGMNLSMKEISSMNNNDEKSKNEEKSSSNNNNNTSSGNVRKRKSLNPTRVATVSSDDDLQYVSTDDSSSDTCIDENGMLIKSDDDDLDNLSITDGPDEDLLDDDDDDDGSMSPTPSEIKKRDNRKSNKSHQQQTKLKAESVKHISHEVEKSKNVADDKNNESLTGDNTEDNAELSALKSQSDDTDENPLRHLESLSKGAFSGLLPTSRPSAPSATSTVSSVSFHAPGLGLADSCKESNGKQNEDLSGRESPVDSIFGDSSLLGSVDIPIDKENPRRCTVCGRVFQNHFGVKTHYQNVHLKLMHKCTVEGCNASFPSRRSRDRHAANLNLHRKLLSTSDRNAFLDKAPIFPYPPGAEFLSGLYDPQGPPMNLVEMYHRLHPDGFILPPGFPGSFPHSLMQHPAQGGNDSAVADGRSSPAQSATADSTCSRSSSASPSPQVPAEDERPKGSHCDDDTTPQTKSEPVSLVT